MTKEQLLDIISNTDACEEGIEDLLSWEGSIEDFGRKHPIYVLWANKYIEQHISDELFDYCVRSLPLFGLHYALERLSDEQFDYCVKEKPLAGLHYALERLSDEQFDYCVKAKPWEALIYALERLSPDQFDYCEKERATSCAY